MRKPPSSAPPPVAVRSRDDIVTQVRRYQVITPLFGGGVRPGQADPVTIIRGNSIRGQLRFWWRACCGGQFDGDLARMKQAEDHLWGTMSTDERPGISLVQVMVKVENAGRMDCPYEVVNRPGHDGQPRPSVRPRGGATAPAYAAFPLQPQQGEATIGMQTKAVRDGIAFTLTLSFPCTDQKGVEAALWAWECFGGIGGRTRRGFGALRCITVDGQPHAEVPPAVPAEAVHWLAEHLQHYIPGTVWPRDVPHLNPSMLLKVIGPPQEPVRAWQVLVNALRAFRQDRPVVREPNGNQHPGRNRWPEPDAIRGRTGRVAPRHATSLFSYSKFPRAVFGLPIIFHFKDENLGDPRDTTLKAAEHERLASPLILRPIACAGGQALGLALVLEGPRTPPGGVILHGAPGNPTVDVDLTPAEAGSVPKLKGQTDVLRAFLDTLR